MDRDEKDDTQRAQRETITIDDSDSDDDKGRSSGSASAAQSTAAGSIAALLGDRAQMERERLARQRKRAQEAGAGDEEYDGRAETSKGAAAAGSSARKSIRLDQSGPSASSNAKSQDRGVQYYWNGAIKKSFNAYSTQAPGTRFEELLRPTTPFQSNGLTHVVMATYCEDIQWLAPMFPKGPKGPEITMITLANDSVKAGVYAPLHPQLPNWIRLVVPRGRGLSAWTTMHMKFLMLFYPDRLRLLILTGNLVDYDWSRIENTAFVHDFARLPQDQEDQASSFGVGMRRILESLSVPKGHFAMRQMPKYDMRTHDDIHLVFSLPTASPISGWKAIEELGLGRLAKVARTIMNPDGKDSAKRKVVIEAQGSSMGTYSPKWLQQMHIICMGLAYRRILPLPATAKPANKAWANATGEPDTDKWPSPIRLLFPSDRWVKTQSIEGVAGAGTFFGKSEASVSKGFIELLHQPVSTRANIMMHHKAILTIDERYDKHVRANTEESDMVKGKDDSSVVGWTYVGSHNLTQAAWGNISKGDGEVQMTIGNWELGIVLPVRLRDLYEAQESGSKEPHSMAASVITWKRNAEKYAAADIPYDQFKQG